MWLFHLFINKTASAVRNARQSADSTCREHRQSAGSINRYIITYLQLVNFLLKKYATDEAIVETKSDITRCTQPSETTRLQYSKKLVIKHFGVGTCMRNML